MQLRTVRGATKEEVFAKRFNICVGCSLGNKWFNSANVRELIRWALDHTREKVCVIADSIHAINIAARSSKTSLAAAR